jgi:hypothetical protein
MEEEHMVVVAYHNLAFVGHSLEVDGYFDYELHIHLFHLLLDT